MSFDWERALYAAAGFAGGLFSQLLKLVIPSYNDLVAANKDLAKENEELREKLRGCEDSLDDCDEAGNGGE